MTLDEFITYYSEHGDEKQETSKFWISLVGFLFGNAPSLRDITSLNEVFEFEKPLAEYGGKGYIDVYFPRTRVLVEQKSISKDLRKFEHQSDGALLNPFQQAKRYADALPLDKKPRWIITCNFKEFYIHDMNSPIKAPEHIMLEELRKDKKARARLEILVNPVAEIVSKQLEISLDACHRISMLYRALEEQYIKGKKENDRDYTQDINIICVRLVFLFYAEKMLLFGNDANRFGRYIESFSTPANARNGLVALFNGLDTPMEDRDQYDVTLKDFPYVNGGLFSDRKVQLPEFDDWIVSLITFDCSRGFDWSGISPTIFGALFESTLNPDTRRNGGMHYTAPENIHKAIDPLFLNDLYEEFDRICDNADHNQRNKDLRKLQDKIAGLRFLDPACGSGNFLTETYISLRKLENDILKITGDKEIKVSISNFFGIEVNDYAVSVGKTAMWIAESQMLIETEDITKTEIEYLPIRNYAHIVANNALDLEWDTLRAQPNLFNDHEKDNGLSDERRVYDYIIGNPPFVGARMMQQDGAQKADVHRIFGNIKDVQDLDYVCCWFKKAAELIQGQRTQVAFVATNSITQGTQVPILWDVLFNKYHIHINFAFRTFRWDSESENVAHVHCVVIGFAAFNREKKYLFEDKDHFVQVRNISPYLLEGDDVFVSPAKEALCDVPKMSMGNMERGNGFLFLTEEERDEVLMKEPDLEKWIRPLLGAEELIKGKKRYCFWLEGIEEAEIKASNILKHRVDGVKKFRMSSNAKTTKGYASTSHLFAQRCQPDTSYIAIPVVSSERRDYIPIAFLPKEYVATTQLQIIPGATLLHFAILTSKVHMAWMRFVCGRLKSDYRYSKEIVYNNFIWLDFPNKEKKKLEEKAQAILDARANHPKASFDVLYDPTFMPLDLRKAHNANDRLVLRLYGLDSHATEEEIVTKLMEMYLERVKQKTLSI